MSWWTRLAIFLLLMGIGGSAAGLLLPADGLESSLRPWLASRGYPWPSWGGWGVRLILAGAVGLGLALLVWVLVGAFKRPTPSDSGGEEIRALLEALRHSDATTRRQAAEALGDRGQEEAIAPLLQMLQESRGQERRAAAEALYKIGRVLTAMVTQERRPRG
jgi:hypothetical protein